LNGQEEMHGTLVGPDGEAEPLLAEVAQTAQEFMKTESAFRGTHVISQVAILNDYESRWAVDWQKHTEKYDQSAVLKSYYQALRKLSQSIDIVSPDAPLDGYQLVVAPDLNIISKERANHLARYVRDGGHLVLGPRSGLKDEYNTLLTTRQPGYLGEELGGHVEQFYALENSVPVSGEWGAGNASIWAEYLKVGNPDTEVLVRYGRSNGWLDGQPAVVTHRIGKGRLTYIGTLLDDSIMKTAAEWMIKDAQVSAAFGKVPDGVEVSRRVSATNSVYVLINFNATKHTIAVPSPMKSLLDEKTVSTIELPQYGVAVLAGPRLQPSR
jgi:beta-galactosidase